MTSSAPRAEVSVEPGHVHVHDDDDGGGRGRGGGGEDWLVGVELAPAAGGALAPLYRAAASGVLALPFCGSCRQVLELGQEVCDRCGGIRQDWRPVQPIGVVHSSTLVHRLEPGLIRSAHPYPVVDVEVASGHRLVMTTTAPATSAPAIGSSVTIGFRAVGGVQVPAVCATGDGPAPGAGPDGEGGQSTLAGPALRTDHPSRSPTLEEQP